MYPEFVPHKNPEDRRAYNQSRAAERRARDKARYDSDEEYRERIKAQRRATYQRNKERIKERTRAYRRENPHVQRTANLKKYGGMTIEDWDALLISQSGRCWICLEPMRLPCIDHSHETGKVRGMLCEACNHGLGKFKDDVERLARAITYLEEAA